MTNLKKNVVALTLTVLMTFGATLAHADGIVVQGFTGTKIDACTETKTDWGIVVQGFTGIVVQGFTGIVVQGATDTQTNCGIVVQG